jgi:protocatechuate 3,4-dioxygenase beta subunit
VIHLLTQMVLTSCLKFRAFLKGESPMACVKRLFNLSIVFAIALVAQSWCITRAQALDSKPKATASITGRVTIGEKAAPGVTVIANLLASSSTLVAQTVTDAEGKYRLHGLTPTGITIAVYAPTYVAPSAPMFAQGRMVLLSADENVEDVDFKLTRGGVITGRITDADGKPVDDRVTLTRVDDRGEPVRGPTRPPNPFVYATDDRGIYRVYGLAAGRYKVSVGDGGSLAILRSGYYQKTYHPDTTDGAKAAIIELGEGGEAKNIDINVGPRSRTYAVSGRIMDADTNQPIAGVNYNFGTVQQNQAQSFISGMSSPGTPTNAKGEFRLEGIAPGRYAITAPGNSSLPTDNQPRIYCDPVQFEITDSDVTNLEVKAQRSLSVSGMVVTGGITNKDALARVSRLIIVGYGQPVSTGLQTYMTPVTSPIAADGTFQLEGLNPGLLSLSISANTLESRGYVISRVTSDRELPNRLIEIAPGQNISGVRVYLSYGSGVIRGEIKVEGGTLPGDAMIFVSLQQENQGTRLNSAQVDARGRFIINGIPAGNYEAILQVISLGAADSPPRGGPRTVRQNVSVSDDSESQITFTLNLTPKVGP